MDKDISKNDILAPLADFFSLSPVSNQPAELNCTAPLPVLPGRGAVTARTGTATGFIRSLCSHL